MTGSMAGTKARRSSRLSKKVKHHIAESGPGPAKRQRLASNTKTPVHTGWGASQGPLLSKVRPSMTPALGLQPSPVQIWPAVKGRHEEWEPLPKQSVQI